jgi:hypothetical protein
MHDKPTLAESMKIWKQTADAFAVSTDGGVTYTAGFDVEGNAVVNILSAIGVNADWVRTGKLLSNDGATLIDMAYGVANTDNINFSDNIQNGYPLTMPFNIDDSVSKINKVLLKFTQQKFRTSSTTASSGGGSSQTSGSGGGTTQSSTSNELIPHGYNYYRYTPEQTLGTGPGNATSPHYHSYTLPSDEIDINFTFYTDEHTHNVTIPNHAHSVDIPNHTHSLNFGIQETPITDNTITIYVDGTLRATVTDTQGVVDLTAYFTTVGWHTIEIRSTVLKRISAQINIKSYIRS